MIIGYDRNPNIPIERKLQSLMESVQMALNETASDLDSVWKSIQNNSEESSSGSSPAYEKTEFNPTSATSYAGYGGCYYEKYGNVIHVHVGLSGMTAGTDYSIFTLPVGCRPTTNLFAHGTGGSWNNIGYVEIRPDGTVHARSVGNYCGADITYLVEGE